MWPESEIRARAGTFRANCSNNHARPCSQRHQNDPDDNHILACAKSGRADVIVSGDKRHLLPLKEYEGMPIVRPVDFLRMLGGL